MSHSSRHVTKNGPKNLLLHHNRLWQDASDGSCKIASGELALQRGIKSLREKVPIAKK